MHAEKKEERKGPKVGEVWGDWSDSWNWRRVHNTRRTEVIYHVYGSREPFTVSRNRWEQWAQDHELISKESPHA